MAKYLYNNVVLYTDQICPPYDNSYCCVDENYDGAPDAGPQIVGNGDTEEEAIEDYFEQLNEMEY